MARPSTLPGTIVLRLVDGPEGRGIPPGEPHAVRPKEDLAERMRHETDATLRGGFGWFFCDRLGDLGGLRIAQPAEDPHEWPSNGFIPSSKERVGESVMAELPTGEHAQAVSRTHPTEQVRINIEHKRLRLLENNNNNHNHNHNNNHNHNHNPTGLKGEVLALVSTCARDVTSPRVRATSRLAHMGETSGA